MSSTWNFQPISENEPILDSLYLYQNKEKLKELNDKINYFEIYHPHHKDLQKMKLIRNRIKKKSKTIF